MGKKRKTITLVAPKGTTWEDVAKRVVESRKREGKTIKCKRCGDKFKVTTFCFHGLCNECFQLFDAQKMAGRTRYNFYGEKDAVWFESADKWIESKKKG